MTRLIPQKWQLHLYYWGFLGSIFTVNMLVNEKDLTPLVHSTVAEKCPELADGHRLPSVSYESISSQNDKNISREDAKNAKGSPDFGLKPSKICRLPRDLCALAVPRFYSSSGLSR